MALLGRTFQLSDLNLSAEVIRELGQIKSALIPKGRIYEELHTNLLDVEVFYDREEVVIHDASHVFGFEPIKVKLFSLRELLSKTAD